jgi:hypothetical protein
LEVRDLHEDLTGIGTGFDAKRFDAGGCAVDLAGACQMPKATRNRVNLSAEEI